MSITAATFLQPALQPVFDLIFSLGVKLFDNEPGGELEGTLKNWNRELTLINDLLDDAVAKQFQSKAVWTWLMELQDLAFDMEDILADFEIKAQEHEFNINTADQQDDDDSINPFSYMVAHISAGVSTLFNTISPSVKSNIEDINRRLHRIKDRIQPLQLSMANNTHQLILQTEVRRSPQNPKETSSILPGTDIFGRDNMKHIIIDRLLLKDDALSDQSYGVIPIVGIGGIGKTTLAQYVYNDEQLKDKFDLKAWVCVSDKFDVTRITATIVRATSASGTHVECSTMEEAQTQLKNILLKRKFLIVLDDIWNDGYDDWISLQAPFQHAAKGSRIIMTTRNQFIAKMMINRPKQDTIINLKGLSDDECWNLFEQHVSDVSDLAEMKLNIIKKCKGLPLAAKALGGLFRKTEDKRQRQMILESNIWSEESGVLPALRLTYDYLPSHLKRIFAYCSLFPKDYEFTQQESILLWMAQGFLPNNDEQRLEDIGHSYFDDLESRSLFQRSPYADGSFIMHDLIHELAVWAAGGICYEGTKNITRVNNRERIRHQYHQYLITDVNTSKSQLLINGRLRTFYKVRGIITNLEFIKSFRYIRALSLVSNTIEVLLECIGDLKHLRFLNLKFVRIEELPRSIKNLWNLQTLWLVDCSRLKKVPYMGFLKKLRHLKIGENLVEIPQGFEKLTNLKSLDYFSLAEGHGSRIKELKNLNYLEGNLRIFGLENVSKVEDAKEAQLHEKSGLDELLLTWGTWKEQVDCNTITDVLEQLKPATSIKECKLDGYMGLILPTWLGDRSFDNIVTIKLLKCTNCEGLPSLGQLPRLERLEIRDMDSIKRVGIEFYGYSSIPFPALKILYFERLKSWEKWEHTSIDNNRAFRCLESLEISYCDSLEGDVPPHTPSLKTLEIKSCRRLQSLPLLEKLRSDATEDVMQRVSEEGNTPTEHVHLQLTTLRINHCPGIHNLKNLTVLDGTYPKILVVGDCKRLESLKVANFSCLSKLSLWSCPMLLSLPRLVPTVILELELSNVGCCGHEVERIPGPDLQLPSSLRELKIEGFENLKTIRCSALPNLSRLYIKCCPKFESFGDTALPLQLEKVKMQECELIKPHLQRDPHNGVIRMDADRYSLR